MRVTSPLSLKHVLKVARRGQNINIPVSRLDPQQ
jgi:hypothetical protein